MRPRGSPYDGPIAHLAVPALGALAAEPLYLLVDTAIVGHLGTPSLAALAVAGSLLTLAVSLCNFLTCGTTAQVARLSGAGRDADAGTLAAQAPTSRCGPPPGACSSGHWPQARCSPSWSCSSRARWPRLFTDDGAVLARAREVWPLFALMQARRQRWSSRSTGSSSARATPAT